jgi:hypothetical protein
MVEDEGIAPMPVDPDQLKGVGQSAQILMGVATIS